MWHLLSYNVAREVRPENPQQYHKQSIRTDTMCDVVVYHKVVMQNGRFFFLTAPSTFTGVCCALSQRTGSDSLTWFFFAITESHMSWELRAESKSPMPFRIFFFIIYQVLKKKIKVHIAIHLLCSRRRRKKHISYQHRMANSPNRRSIFTQLVSNEKHHTINRISLSIR